MKPSIDINKLKPITECKGRIKDFIGDEGILSLAKDGIIPHYILTNPLTKEESIWFIPSDLNEWLISNYVRYNEGYYTPHYSFMHLDREEYKITSAVPVELLKIKNLYQLPLEYVNTPPGVYFLCRNNTIQYIGRATNITDRILTHTKGYKKFFDTVFFITCPLETLNELEAALIHYIKPPQNEQIKKSIPSDDIAKVESILGVESKSTK